MYSSASYSGRRMLAGSMLSGVLRPTTTAGGACLVKSLRGPDAVDMNTGYMEYGSEPVHLYAPSPAEIGLANYNYEGGADP